MRLDDPWYDSLSTGGSRPACAPSPGPAQPQGDRTGPVRTGTREAYLTIQRSAAFHEVRGRYRRFVWPAGAAFVLWYLAYVVLAVCAPGLMAGEVAGVLNVAMVAGLAQFASTFLLTWLYARHARLRRDRLAFELRWRAQDAVGAVRTGAREGAR
ncbi:DUF485 domain-containing protein [Streptomyces tubbatahanensis]|uniref:DUF485 domain-containing protein n=1 Tax=Streptomyces tubbatahanensis TaxID=2923272 RepID=A0ABY3XXY2_9ACTN|nr:DUF485 domain-containing protein [Streptomyces tubbatahanensis]UNS99402.1 DUF485 domain-containing protein [Streptomyces tubbatahanensis]